MLKRYLALLFAILISASAHAQPTQSALVEQVRQAYRELDYENAERKARDILENYSDFTVQQLTDTHTILALIAYNRGDFIESQRHFTSAFQLTPDLELDPVLVPPKIQQYFEDVKTELLSGGTRSGPDRYVLVRDPRPDAAVRSMIVPGWGQLFKGQERKAMVLAASWTGTVAGALWSHYRRGSARDEYEAAVDPDSIRIWYDRYNGWHKTRNALAQGAAIVWFVSYIDALLTNPARRASQNPLAFSLRKEDDLALYVRPSGIAVLVRF